MSSRRGAKQRISNLKAREARYARNVDRLVGSGSGDTAPASVSYGASSRTDRRRVGVRTAFNGGREPNPWAFGDEDSGSDIDGLPSFSSDDDDDDILGYHSDEYHSDDEPISFNLDGYGSLGAQYAPSASAADLGEEVPLVDDEEWDTATFIMGTNVSLDDLKRHNESGEADVIELSVANKGIRLESCSNPRDAEEFKRALASSDASVPSGIDLVKSLDLETMNVTGAGTKGHLLTAFPTLMVTKAESSEHGKFPYRNDVKLSATIAPAAHHDITTYGPVTALLPLDAPVAAKMNLLDRDVREDVMDLAAHYPRFMPEHVDSSVTTTQLATDYVKRGSLVEQYHDVLIDEGHEAFKEVAPLASLVADRNGVVPIDKEAAATAKAVLKQKVYSTLPLGRLMDRHFTVLLSHVPAPKFVNGINDDSKPMPFDHAPRAAVEHLSAQLKDPSLSKEARRRYERSLHDLKMALARPISVNMRLTARYRRFRDEDAGDA